MALPGLSLPGLGASAQPSQTGSIPALSTVQVQKTRIEDLAPRTEWRFEVSFQQTYSIKLLSGQAEIFGVELAANQTYSLSGSKGSVFSWQGCQLEINGEAESEYRGEETEYAVEWLNLHGMLETARDDAHGLQQSEGGPRVLIAGPDHVGKSSLVRSLTSMAVKSGRTPIVVNTDPREGLLAPPGSLTAVAVSSQMDVEDGYGISPISGPTVTPIKTPLIYHYPFGSPLDKPSVYKALTTRMAVSITSRMEEDPEIKKSGLIIDTHGALNDPKSNYDILAHLISEFSITCILTIGSERLFNDLNRRFGSATTQEQIPVLKISKPGGAVERDAPFMKLLHARQIRQYLYGTARESLNPHSQTYSFSDLAIFRAQSTSDAKSILSSSTAPETDEDDEDNYDPYTTASISNPNQTFERMTPSLALLNGLIAIKFCPGSNSGEEAIRDAAVMGFLFVAEVDEIKKRVRVLAPGPHKWGDRALVWGPWPEAIIEGVST